MSNDKKTLLVNKNIVVVERRRRRDVRPNINVPVLERRVRTVPSNLHRTQTLSLREPSEIAVNVIGGVKNEPVEAETDKTPVSMFADAKPLQNGSQPRVNKHIDPVSQPESLRPQPKHSSEQAEVKNEKVERISLSSFAPEDLLSTEETAKILSFSRSTLANWRCMKKGPNYVKCGHSVRYEVKEIQAYIKLSRRTSKSGQETGHE